MRKPIVAALLLSTYLASMQAKAAESVDEAVSQIAEQFVASRSDTDPAVRLAVAPFIQSGVNTQFADFLLVALTGKMVRQGSGKFKVVEKAQFDRAYQEIIESDESGHLFDEDTTQELGKVLSVETLVVGEITPLTDRVRVDARLVKVQTLELLEQANVWIPLTPTVRRQLDSITRRPKALGDNGPDQRNGIWSGTGQCGDLSFGLALSLLVNNDDTLTAMQTYYPLASGDTRLEPGVFTMEGTINPDNGEFTLSPDSWMFRPRGHTVSGFSGVLDVNSGSIKANYTSEGCSEIRLNKKL